MVRHLVSIKINYKTKTVFCFRAINITCFRAALLHVARVFSTFALARPVVALGVLVRAARVRRGGEREQSESWYSSRHRACRIWPLFLALLGLFSLRRRARQPFALVERCGGVRATSVIFSAVFFGGRLSLGSGGAATHRSQREHRRATNNSRRLLYKDRDSRI